MYENLGVLIVAVVGGVSMVIITYAITKIMLNTLRYANGKKKLGGN